MNFFKGCGQASVLLGFVTGCMVESPVDAEPISVPARRGSALTMQSGLGFELTAPCPAEFWADDLGNGYFYLVHTSVGTDSTTSGFPETWRDARRTGRPRAGIHAFVLGEAAIDQAIWFLSHTSSDDWGELPPVLDLESSWVEKGMSTKACEREWLRWLRRVEAVMGCRPILKMSSEFANQHIQDTLFHRYPLWLSDWESDAQHVPKIWKDMGWAFAPAPTLGKGPICSDGARSVLCQAVPNFSHVQHFPSAHE